MKSTDRQHIYSPLMQIPLIIGLLTIVNDINFRTLMSEVCCGADKRFYLKVQILMSFTILMLEIYPKPKFRCVPPPQAGEHTAKQIVNEYNRL